jgi:uncharacterized membrane protein
MSVPHEVEEPAVDPRPAVIRRFVVIASARGGLFAMIAAFVIFVSVQTIRQHQALETRAFDLGVFESVLWNTVHGRFFWSPLLFERHLGQHSSFILLTLVPVYAAAPRPETLLVAQAVLLGVAAWPLFLIAERLLRSRPQALLVAVLYLLHPAIGSAAFYDFHELAFAPLLFFFAYWFHLIDRPALFWTFVAIFLLVKEDLSLVIIGFGLSCLLAKQWKRGVALLLAGAAAYVVFVHVVIAGFSHPGQSFGWYYEGLVPSGAPPSALLWAVLSDPVRVMALAFQREKIKYVVQLTAPLCFFSFFTLRGVVLMAYGFAMSLLATRELVYSIGFQYTLHVVPYAFVGALLAIVRFWPVPSTRTLGVTRRAVLCLWALASAVFCMKYGMVGVPNRHFHAGFRHVNLSISPDAQERYGEVREMAARIPVDASVTASETLVPHVARREELQTLRYAGGGPGAEYEIFFVLKSELGEWATRFPEVFAERSHMRVADGKYTVIYQKR